MLIRELALSKALSFDIARSSSVTRSCSDLIAIEVLNWLQSARRQFSFGGRVRDGDMFRCIEHMAWSEVVLSLHSHDNIFFPIAPLESERSITEGLVFALPKNVGIQVCCGVCTCV